MSALFIPTLRHPAFFFLMAMLLFPHEPFAADNDTSLIDLNIQADQMVIDKEKSFSRYSGHVQVNYGDKTLTAEQVNLFFKDESLHTIIATGNPVTLIMSDPQGDIQGTARQMTFLLNEQKIRLQRNALIMKNEDRFSGEIIEYDLTDHTIIARKDPSSSEQVKMTIKAPAQKQ